MKFDNIMEDHIFIIDSQHLHLVKTNLYGFAIYEQNVIFNQNLKQDMEFDGTGAYVHVLVNDDIIKIFQDLIGSFGLYVFKKEDYFAISNSFYKLIEHIKERFEISLNYDYAVEYMTANLCPFIYEETLINEIKVLPRNCYIDIDKSNNNISFEYINYEENTVLLNSPDGIELLDSWFDKWFNIINNVLLETDSISCDLTGGIDSRVIISLLIASNVDLNLFNVNSLTYQREDYEIASKIAKDFNFGLNRKLNIEYDYFTSIDDPLYFSFYTKLGFKTSFRCTNSIPKHFVYQFTGYGGESIRGYHGETVESSLKHRSLVAKEYSESFEEQIKNYHEKNYNKLNKIFPVENSNELNKRLYKETRLSYHFGRNIVEKFMMNYIFLCPLIDPLLFKLKLNDENCDDDNLIVATIYDRYCSRILNYKFQGNRKIDDSTLNYIKSINKKYPFDKYRYNLKTFSKKHVKFNKGVQQSVNKKGIQCNDIINFLKEVFKSDKFKKMFIEYFPIETYCKVLYKLNNNVAGALGDIYPIICILKVINDIEYSKEKNHDIVVWLKSFSEEIKPENKSEFELNNIIFKVPPNYWVNSDTSITNGQDTIYFKIIDDNNINSIISSYEEHIKRKNGVPIEESFNINGIYVYKVRNSKSKTTRFWFTKNDVIYQIYAPTDIQYIDSKVKYLVNSIINNNKLIIGDIMFLLPPKYSIKSLNSIFNGKSTIYFKIENKNSDIFSCIESYEEYIKRENGVPIKESFNINGIYVYKVRNSKSKTTRFWFAKNDAIYQIFTYSHDFTMDTTIKYLINKMI